MILKTDPRVANLERADGEMRVTLHDPGLHHGFLVECLVAANVAVDAVAPHQLKLEDVFLRLTGRSLVD